MPPTGITIQTSKMKFHYICFGPDQQHRDKSFTRKITAVTTEHPKEPGRPAFIQIELRMTQNTQSVEHIKTAIEKEVGHPIELEGGFHYQK